MVIMSPLASLLVAARQILNLSLIYAVLKEIASALKSQSGKSLTIIGHTDSDGGNDLNMKLSADRAKAVKAVLENDFGVTNSITTQGKGASEPVSVNNTAAGKAKNRRVQFQLN